MTIRTYLLAARSRLTEAGIPESDAGLDAALLAREVLGWDRARLLAHDTDPAPDGFHAAFDRLVARRVHREPISSIIGHREFWGLEFEVTNDVLTPRSESEVIVEEAIACLGSHRGSRLSIVDVGTGSGCLAVSLAREFPLARVVAIDISAAALEVAARNAATNDVADRVEFRKASLLDGMAPPVDLVVSNPPYVVARSIPALMPEVRKWEPHVALDGGTEGLDAIRDLVAAVPGVLAPDGWFIMEFGYGQEDAVREIIGRSPLALVRVTDDLQGIPRTVVCHR